MIVTPTTIEEAVSSLNDELHRNIDEKSETDIDPRMLLEYHTNGNVQAVLLADVVLWDSEEDERPYDEASDTHMPLEAFLRTKLRKFREFFDKMLSSF
jgi:hypothetical protein